VPNGKKRTSRNEKAAVFIFDVSANIIKRIYDRIVFVFLFMTFLIRPLYLAILLLIKGPAEAQAPVQFKTNPDNNTVLWEVSGNGLTTSSYLLGTFHLLCKEDVLFSDALKQAVKNASAVYMELDMDAITNILG